MTTINFYKYISLIAAFFLPVMQSSMYAEGSCVVDDLNTKVCLQNKVERIVSLSPHITELIYAIDMDDRLVGVMQGSDYPPEAASKNIMGDYTSVSSERILYANPDLIVTWPAAVSARIIDRLRKYGFSIYHSDPVSISGIEENIIELGKLSGHEVQASKVVASMREELNALREDYTDVPAVNAVILISERPLMALSNIGLIKEAFFLCRAENVFAELPSEAAMVSPELLVKNIPDVILTTFPVDDKEFLARMRLAANAKPLLVELDPDLILRQTPRFLQGVREFCNALHPDYSFP